MGDGINAFIQRSADYQARRVGSNSATGSAGNCHRNQDGFEQPMTSVTKLRDRFDLTDKIAVITGAPVYWRAPRKKRLEMGGPVLVDIDEATVRARPSTRDESSLSCRSRRYLPAGAVAGVWPASFAASIRGYSDKQRYQQSEMDCKGNAPGRDLTVSTVVLNQTLRWDSRRVSLQPDHRLNLRAAARSDSQYRF
jgi:hypothetical protein